MRKIGVCVLTASLALAACQESTVGPAGADTQRISGVAGGLVTSASTVTRGFGCSLNAGGISVFTTNSVSIQDSPTTSTLICDFFVPVEQRPIRPVTLRGLLCGTLTGLTSNSLAYISTNGFARLQCYDTT